MNINKILDYIKTTDLHETWLVEDLRGCSWSMDGSGISDLLWSDCGEEYSAEAPREIVTLNDLIFINADSGFSGYKLTYVFNTSDQVNYGDWE